MKTVIQCFLACKSPRFTLNICHDSEREGHDDEFRFNERKLEKLEKLTSNKQRQGVLDKACQLKD